MSRRNKNSLSLGGAAAREARLRAAVNRNEIISTKSYNMIMGLVVAYGLLVNAIICKVVGNAILQVNPIVFLIGMLVCCFAGTFISRRASSPAVTFLGYNMVVIPMGLAVSEIVYVYGGITSGVVMLAFADTLLITVLMILSAMLFPNFFSRIGGVLFVALIGIILSSFVSMFLGGSGYVISIVAAGVFSLYIGFDFWRSQQFPKTTKNAIDCALDIYLDIINLFIHLLEILGKSDR